MIHFSLSLLLSLCCFSYADEDPYKLLQKLQTMKRARSTFATVADEGLAYRARSEFFTALQSIRGFNPDQALRQQANEELLQAAKISMQTQGDWLSLPVTQPLVSMENLLSWSFYEDFSEEQRMKILYEVGEKEFVSRRYRQIFPADFRQQLDAAPEARPWQIQAAFAMFQMIGAPRENFSYPVMTAATNESQFEALKLTMSYYGANATGSSLYKYIPAIRWVNTPNRVELYKLLLSLKDDNNFLSPAAVYYAVGPHMVTELLRTPTGENLLQQMAKDQLHLRAAATLMKMAHSLKQLRPTSGLLYVFVKNITTVQQVEALELFSLRADKILQYNIFNQTTSYRTRQPVGDWLAARFVPLYPDTAYLYGEQTSSTNTHVVTEDSRQRFYSEFFGLVGLTLAAAECETALTI